jgi:hypothetical protein
MRKTNAFVGSPVERIEDLRLLKGRGAGERAGAAVVYPANGVVL